LIAGLPGAVARLDVAVIGPEVSGAMPRGSVTVRAPNREVFAPGCCPHPGPLPVLARAPNPAPATLAPPETMPAAALDTVRTAERIKSAVPIPIEPAPPVVVSISNHDLAFIAAAINARLSRATMKNPYLPIRVDMIAATAISPEITTVMNNPCSSRPKV
jgi:hypothetical protein